MPRPSPFSARDALALLRVLDPHERAIDFRPLLQADLDELQRILAALQECACAATGGHRRAKPPFSCN